MMAERRITSENINAMFAVSTLKFRLFITSLLAQPFSKYKLEFDYLTFFLLLGNSGKEELTTGRFTQHH